MRKESVQKFDLEAAFKALNEVEIPVVKGIRPNREDLQEKFTHKLVTDILVEDYYDVGDSEELGAAQEEREAEIAKAKLARIEKIVDLEAETEEDLLPSYVGKFIIQCPQCMTLFYKNEEDVERSEEAPDVVNINEPCQHCGNSSGYTLIGKVDTVGEEEAAQYDVDDFEENELDLNFDEEEAPTEEPAEADEEVATEGETEEETDLDLAPIEDGEEEEEVQESLSLREAHEEASLNLDPAIARRFTKAQLDSLTPDEIEILKNPRDRAAIDELIAKYNPKHPLDEATIYTTKAEMEKLDKEVEEATKEVAKYKIPMKAQKNSAGETENIPDFEAVPEAQREAAKKAYDRYQKAVAARPDRAKNVISYTDESLTEDIDKDLDAKLKAHNDYIEYLKNMIAQEEESLKKAENEFVKKAIQRRLDAFKADLEEALPEAIKDEVAVTDLPTPEEADMSAAAENTDESEAKKEKTEKKESLTEDIDAERKLAAEEAALEKTDAEDYIVEATSSGVMQALDALEAELTESLPREPQVYDMRGNLIRVKDPEVLAIWGKVIDQAEAEGITFWNDYATQKRLIDTALTPEEIEKLKDVEFEDGSMRSAYYESLKEGARDVSDAEFRAMLNNPVFNEGCKKDLEEDFPAVDSTPFEKAAAAIEAAGSELTPEEQKLEDEELAAKEGVDESLDEAATAVAEPAVETTDLLADDGTMAMLIYPDRFTAEERKEKLLADPDFVKTLKAFSTKHKMLANSEDLEDGVSAEEDMYNCTFEGIEGEDLEDTLDELISYYLDIKAGWDGEWKEEDEDNTDELTEAPVAAPPAPSRLKRNYSTTELIVKELKADPLFAELSIRTIQRILLPYYISNMGRRELSAQAMIDFFTEEGFAPYVLDHFFQMDPLARKELLKADTKFMELFNKFAKTYKMFPTSSDEKAPGESDFDFAFSIAFDLDENGVAQNNEIAKETIEAFSRWYVAGKIDGNLVADFWDVVDDFDEKKFNTVTENYLTNVYSNVQSFETIACNLEDNKLIVEGIIKFASGKTKNTTFTYETKKAIGRTIVLEGLNADFASEKAFTLNCKVDTENCLIVESLNYKYTINNTLVEGLLK